MKPAAFATVLALSLLPAFYAVLRGVERLTLIEPDLALAPPSPQIALFWRFAAALVVAAGAIGPIHRVAVRFAVPPTLPRRVLLGSAAMLLLQTVFFP